MRASAAGGRRGDPRHRENQPKDRIATKAPIACSLENIKISPWVVVDGVLRSAFINAFAHGLGLNLGDGSEAKTAGIPSNADDRPRWGDSPHCRKGGTKRTKIEVDVKMPGEETGETEEPE